MRALTLAVLVAMSLTGRALAAPPPAAPAAVQDAAETQAAIKAAALDYAEGWYDGDASRMERALHPDLAKRMVQTDEKGRSRIEQMSAMGLVLGTRRGFGKSTPKERQQKDVVILDVFANVASVRATMSDWIDYMHVAKFNGRWVIVNVLWEMKPKQP